VDSAVLDLADTREDLVDTASVDTREDLVDTASADTRADSAINK